MRLEAIRKPEGDEAQCRSCGGAVHRRPFGEMHAGSYVHDGKRVEIRRAPRDGFQNPVVLDALTQYFDGGLYRLYPSDRYFAKGGKRIHRAVWQDAFGPIPRGCHIHHRDANPANNELENLECIDADEHLKIPRSDGLEKRGGKHFSDSARQSAANWHRSEEGRLWHKRHAERSQNWKKWKREPRNCEHCGQEFQALIRENGKQQQKFCHANCKASHYRQRKALGND